MPSALLPASPAPQQAYDPRANYWALQDDPEIFIREVNKRCVRYLEFLTDSGMADRIDRSWRMYYGVETARGGTSVQIAGEEGEIRIAEVNELRASLGLLKTYITQHRPEWDVLTASSTENDDVKALETAERGNAILDALMADSTRRIEPTLAQAVEDAIVFSHGYVWNLWDESMGPPKWANPENGQMLYTGDFRYLNPGPYDVCFDYTVRDFYDSRWVDIRRLENRWDLMAAQPELATEIMNVRDDYHTKYARFDFRFGRRDNYRGEEMDFLWVHYFYLRPSPAAPMGRFVRRVGNVILDERGYLPEGHVPLHRMVPAQFQMTPFGYSPAFSCQAPQELLTNVLSAIATNQNALANIKIHKKGGDPINRATLEPGITVIETDGEIKAINLLQSSPELYSSVEMFTQMVRAQSQVNDSARGFSNPNESGAARAFEEQRTQQGAIDIVSAYDGLSAALGTSILKGYRLHLEKGEERRLQAAGQGGQIQQVELSRDALDGIDRVAVVRGNPELRTMAGRIRVADTLMQSGAANLTREEYITVVMTGDISKLIESEKNELDIVHAENAALLAGQMLHVANPFNNQMLHIRKHTAAAKSREAQKNPEIVKACYAAATEHFELWMTQSNSLLQGALGYNPGPMGAMMGAQPQQPATPSGQPGTGQKPKPAGGDKPPAQGGGPRLVGGPSQKAPVASSAA